MTSGLPAKLLRRTHPAGCAAVWHRAAHYVGSWFRDARPAYVADNLRVLRAIDLAPFNVFDLDAWGGPWDQAHVIANRRQVADGEMIGLVMTDGGTINVHLGNIPKTLCIPSVSEQLPPG